MEDRRRVLQGDGGANADDGCGNGSELVDIRAGQEANESPWRLSELQAAQYAASGGHMAVVDLLAGEFGAWIFVGCLIRAALLGHDAMIVRRLSFITRVSSSLSMMEPRGSSQRDCVKYRSHRPLPASPVRAGSLPFGAARTRDDVDVTVDMRTL